MELFVLHRLIVAILFSIEHSITLKTPQLGAARQTLMVLTAVDRPLALHFVLI